MDPYLLQISVFSRIKGQMTLSLYLCSCIFALLRTQIYICSFIKTSIFSYCKMRLLNLYIFLLIFTRLEDDPTMAQDDRKTAQDGPKTAQNGPKKGPKTAPRGFIFEVLFRSAFFQLFHKNYQTP